MRKILALVIVVFISINIILESSISWIDDLNNYVHGDIERNLFNYTWTKSITLQAPAVSSGNKGILSNITLILAYPGHGFVYFTALPFTELDTQITIRTAAWIASVIAGFDYNKYDYYVLMKADYPIIGGPSAGALVATGFLSLLLNKSIRPYITMTGMINPDGTIGPVGGLKEKIEVASRNNYSVFLIPRGQRIYSYPVVYEERFLWGVIRRIEYRTIDLVEYGKTLNISVIEVGNLLEVFSIATGFDIETVNDIVLRQTNVLDRVVQEESSTMFSNLDRDFSTVEELIKRVSNPYDKYVFESIYRDLYSKYIGLKNSLNSGKAYYSLFECFDLSASVFKLVWFLKIYHREASIDNLIEHVNSTLNNLLIDLNNSIKYIHSFNELVLFSTIYAYFKIGSYYMINAIDSYRSGNMDKTFINIEKVIYYTKQCEFLTKLAKQVLSNKTGSIIIPQNLIDQIYSTALSSYSYVYALSEETGLTPSTWNSLSIIYSNLMDEKSIYNVIGSGLLVIAYSSSSIHLLFSEKTLNNVLNTAKNIIRRSLYLTGNLTIIEELFYKLSLEYIDYSDYSNALIYLCIVNSIQQILVIGYTQKGEVFNLPPIAPIGFEYSNVTQTSEYPTNIYPITRFYRQLEKNILFIIIAITILLISIIIIIYVVLKHIKHIK